MILTALLILAQQQGPLPEYPVSIRCAALAEAAHKLDPDEVRTRPYFDAALYWGLAASERARKDGIASDAFKAEQIKARALAVTDLSGGTPGPKAELVECLAKVPNLKT
jgi:hypothetical protein